MVTDSLGMRINYLLGEQYKYKFQTALPTSQPGGAPVKLLSCIDEDREISAVPNSAGYMRSSNDWPAKKNRVGIQTSIQSKTTQVNESNIHLVNQYQRNNFEWYSRFCRFLFWTAAENCEARGNVLFTFLHLRTLNAQISFRLRRERSRKQMVRCRCETSSSWH